MDAGTSLMSLFIRIAPPAGGSQLALSLLYDCCDCLTAVVCHETSGECTSRCSEL